MSTLDAPEAQPQHQSDLTIQVEGSRHLFYRRFTQADLHSIQKIILEGPFNRTRWTISGRHGTTTGTDLSEILRNTLWPSVRSVILQASRESPTTTGGFSIREWGNEIFFCAESSTAVYVKWEATAQNRQPVELTYDRLVQFLKKLPLNLGFRPRFVDAQQKPKWWNPFRAPRSILDWIAIAIIAGLAVAAITLLFTFL